MILDQEKFERLVNSKLQKYNDEASSQFFKQNQGISPCSMSEKATILYHLLQRGVDISEQEFTEEDKKEVEAFTVCLERQMELVLKGELKPVNMEISSIQDLVYITKEEIESCCISEEEIKKMIDG